MSIHRRHFHCSGLQGPKTCIIVPQNTPLRQPNARLLNPPQPEPEILRRHAHRAGGYPGAKGEIAVVVLLGQSQQLAPIKNYIRQPIPTSPLGYPARPMLPSKRHGARRKDPLQPNKRPCRHQPRPQTEGPGHHCPRITKRNRP